MAYTQDPNDVVAALQKLASTTKSGSVQMRSAPAKAPEQTSEFPFAVSVLRRFNPIKHADSADVLCVYATQIHICRNDLPANLTLLQGFGLSYLIKLLSDLTLGGLVSTISHNGIQGRQAVLEYGGVATIGFDIEIPVKMTIVSLVSS